MNSKMFETTESSKLFNILAESKDYRQLVYIAERMYGTGGFGNSLAFCTAIEGASHIIIPERAQYIRTILNELSLIQENLLRLAAIAESISFESLSMLCWSRRENILNIIDELTGNRMLTSLCCVGGVRRDFTVEELNVMLNKLQTNTKDFDTIKRVVISDRWFANRLKGIGTLTKEDAEESSVTGPAAKGSGVAIDRRSLGEYGAYKSLGFKTITENGCDCHARVVVKIREIYQSMELIEKAVKGIPEGAFAVDAPDKITGEWITKVEQADGADTYFIKGCDSAYLEEVGIRKAGESNEKVMYRVKNYSPENEALVRLSLGIDECLRER